MRVVECPSCGKEHEIPDSAIPEDGTTMRCPGCSTSFKTFPSGATAVVSNGSSKAGDSGNGGGSTPFMTGGMGEAQAPSEAAILDDAPTLEEGSVLNDQFEVSELIGQGAYANVYRVQDRDLGEEFALKAIPSFDQADEVLHSLADEYRAQRKIQSQYHILRVERPSRCQHAGMEWALLPMELADQSMRDWLEENEEPEERIEEGMALFRQACRGVAALHEAGLAHLDLKPENMLLIHDPEDAETENTEWVLKLGDFGLVRDLEEREALHPELLEDGVGTPHYMAPEQVFAARPQEVGPKADLYALGVILFEIADGEVPFHGCAEDVRRKHQEVDPPSVSPAWVDAIVQRCLAKKPDDRPEDVQTLLELTRPDPQEETDFRDAEETDTISAYESFLEAWPDGLFAPQAQKRIEEIRKRKRWEARREDLLDKARTRLDAEEIEMAGEVLETLDEHLGEQASRDDEYQEVKQRHLEARRKRQKEWEERRQSLIASVREAIDDEDVDTAQQSLRKLRDHLGEDAEDDQTFQSLRAQVKEVTKTVERRRHATEQVSRANDFINEARFEEAESCLQEVHEEYRSAETVASAWERLEEARSIVQEHLSAAEENLRSRDLEAAIEHAEEVLDYCSEAEKAREIRQAALNHRDGAEKAIDQARDLLRAASFDDAEEALQEARGHWPHHSDLESLEEEYRKTKRRYQNVLDRAESAWERRELEAVEEACGELLEFCPEATKPQRLQSKAEDERRATSLALKQAQTELKRANFDLAEKELEEARQHWPSSSDVKEATSEFESIRRAYRSHREDALAALEKGRFDAARLACESMREECPEATEPDELSRRIENTEKKQRKRKAFRYRVGTSGGLVLFALVATLWLMNSAAVASWLRQAGFKAMLLSVAGGIGVTALCASSYYIFHKGPYFEDLYPSSWRGSSPEDLEAQAAFLGALALQMTALLLWLAIGGWFTSFGDYPLSSGVVLGILLHIVVVPVFSAGWVRYKLEIPLTLLGLEQDILLDSIPDPELRRKRKPLLRGMKVFLGVSGGILLIVYILGFVEVISSANIDNAKPEAIISTASQDTLRVFVEQGSGSGKAVYIRPGSDSEAYKLDTGFSGDTSLDGFRAEAQNGNSLVCFDALDPEWRVNYCWNYRGDVLYYRAASRSTGEVKYSENVGGEPALKRLLTEDS